MKTLILSDLHAHAAWPFSRPLADGTPSRFQDLLNVLGQAEQVIQDHGVAQLFLLGDLTHRRHFINFRLYNRLMAAVAGLTELVERTVIIPGNHDYEDAQTHSLYPFAYLPHTAVVDEPWHSQEFDAVFIPWLPDTARMIQAFEEAPSGWPLFSHYATEGAPMETDWWLESPLKLGEMDKHPIAVFGHVHKPSELLNGRVWYVGAPMHFDFGDHGPRRGLLWDGGTGITPVPFRFPQFVTAKYPRIPLVPMTGGYLRILDVPGAEQVDVRGKALAMGWTDATTLEAALPPEVREAVTSGLILGEDMLREHVARRAPDLDAAQQQVLVDEGLTLLEEARR